MIAFLKGTIAEKSAGRVVVEVNGTGYDLLVSASTVGKLPAVGKAGRIYTRLQARDDAMVLYGFASKEERELFDLLVSVNGVGPKVALAFLSVLAPEAFRRAVAAGDVAALTVVPGVGRKVAQRVVLDLKDRLGGDVIVVEGPMADVREAMLSLGITPQEVTEAMAGLSPDGGRPVEELLRLALQRVGRAEGTGSR